MIDKDKFREQVFKSTGIRKRINDSKLARVPDQWSPKNNMADLREEIRNIMWEKTDAYKEKTKKNFGDYIIVEECCRIPTDTMKKALNGRYNITRNFLAKFTVGFKVDIETANSLFEMHSGEINLTNDFDFIVFHALKTKDDIDDFIEEVEELLDINLDKTR